MPTFQTILVPVDFSDHASRALDFAIDFAKQFKSKLHLVHSYPIHPIAVSPYGVALPPDLDRSFREAADKQLEAWAARVRQSGLSVETTTASDSPAEAITQCAEKIHADLIVMSTRGLTGLKHVMLGSVAERTLRHAHCPVLTLKSH
jgi:nucleotide-binding universal stress UspA family protein